MKRLVFALISIFTFVFSISAQSPCPSISVTGPSGIATLGDALTFTANLSKEAENYKIEYLWTVSNGKILIGQGANVIKVLQNNVGETITATLEVKGLPKNCPNTISASGEIIICNKTTLFDEFSHPRRVSLKKN